MRAIIASDPFPNAEKDQHWHSRGQWPARWIGCPGADRGPVVTAYRLRFEVKSKSVARVHVTADERYELFLDGERIGRGSERGDRDNWFFETYDIPMTKGEHVIVARVRSLGGLAAYAQMSVRPGFMLAAEGEFTPVLSTGSAAWEAKKLGGYTFVFEGMAWGTGANLDIDASKLDQGVENGDGDGWLPAELLHDAVNGFTRNEIAPIHRLKPSTLPPMLERELNVGAARFVSDIEAEDVQTVPVRSKDRLSSELEQWNLLKSSAQVTIPANTARRVIIDLENYYCAYPELITTGGKGSVVTIRWTEGLFESSTSERKGNRNEIDGKFFRGVGDTFRPDGGSARRFTTLWWQAGRYVEVTVRTGDEPLTIDSLKLRETRYPLEMEGTIESSDTRFDRAVPIMVRGMQMCSHETYMDCPFYEQLMYVGDTRLEVLTTYCMTHDDRLPRKALAMFNASRQDSGLTQSRYPTRVRQLIPPFSLWFVAMVHDFALWRGDMEYVRSLMPAVRSVLDAFRSFINADGLVQAPEGWNFVDWVPNWFSGVPLDGQIGASGIINWHTVLALQLASELEEWVDEPEMAARNFRHAEALAERTKSAFWDERKSLFADDLSKKRFSEHAQCLAVLSGMLDAPTRQEIAKSLLSAKDLERTTIYFTHYLFETYRKLGLIDALFDRLQLWYDLEKHGFKTTFEMPEPSRSDCHAWGAHPLYHYYASILGIRPTAPGFKEVRIEPQLGPLTHAKGKLPHPNGFITVDFTVLDGRVTGSVELPEGVTGTSSPGEDIVVVTV